MVYGGPHKDLLLEETFLDKNGEPDNNISTGASRAVYAYNGDLLRTSVRYYDVDGNAVRTTEGYATQVREYGNGGTLLWEATFDETGSLNIANGQYAVAVHTYDYTGHHTGECFYDADGSILLQGSGYASVTYDYDVDASKLFS